MVKGVVMLHQFWRFHSFHSSPPGQRTKTSCSGGTWANRRIVPTWRHQQLIKIPRPALHLHSNFTWFHVQLQQASPKFQCFFSAARSGTMPMRMQDCTNAIARHEETYWSHCFTAYGIVKYNNTTSHLIHTSSATTSSTVVHIRTNHALCRVGKRSNWGIQCIQSRSISLRQNGCKENFPLTGVRP